jgi:hypothetical protein
MRDQSRRILTEAMVLPPMYFTISPMMMGSGPDGPQKRIGPSC